MPRRVEVFPGYDGYSEVDAFELTDVQMDSLAELLGPLFDSNHRDYLRRQVEEVGNQWRNWHERGASAFSRAEAREALDNLACADVIDREGIEKLNGRAEQLLHDHLCMSKGIASVVGDSVWKALVEDRIPEPFIRRALANAIASLKSRKGAEPQGDIHICVRELSGLYQELTGRYVTHSVNKNDPCDARSHSHAGEFVTACFECFGVIDREDRHAKHENARMERRISAALRDFVHARRALQPATERSANLSGPSGRHSSGQVHIPHTRSS